MTAGVDRHLLERLGAKLLVCATRAVAGALIFAAAAASAQPAPADAVIAENKPEPKNTNLEAKKPLSIAATAWNVLADEIRSHSRTRRSNAIAALAVIGPRRDVLSLLEAALHDKNADIRKEAAIALGALPAPAAKPSLRARLRDESPDVAFAAADALWKMGDRSGRDLVIDTLDGRAKGKGLVKSSMKSQFGKYRDPKALAFKGATEAAGAFVGPLPIGITIAQELLKDRTASARAACAQMLGKDSSPEAVEELAEARFDKSWAVRAAALQALAVSPGKVSIEVFAPMLYDGHAEVRDMAAAGIIRRSEAPMPAEIRWPLEETETTAEAMK